MHINPSEEITILKLQIELEESNYKYGIELQKEPTALLSMKERIRELKELLVSLENTMQKS